MAWLDAAVYALVFPVLWWIFLNGWDELFIDACYIYYRLHRRLARDACYAGHGAGGAVEKRIAILVPLWREHSVIEEMVHHNVAALDYRSYDIFLGAYPNDSHTLEKVLALEQRYANVRHAVCPHDGPTNKADCLNWLYRRMAHEEAQLGFRYDVVVQHDAEDIIHAASLRVISAATDEFPMVQIPVFPLENGFRCFTQGTYCDEFAEWQWKDLAVRQHLGGFLPSAGVGTAYRREVLDQLARQSPNVFHTGTVTEDYEVGLRVSRLGLRQGLVAARVPVRSRGNGNGNGHKNGRNGNGHAANGQNARLEYVATRESFPRSFRDAVRQKSRWIMGVSLEAWQQHGWGASPRQWYWLWRDRKGLIGNIASVICNFIFFYCLFMLVLASAFGTGWTLSRVFPAGATSWLLLSVNTFFLLERLAFRIFAVHRIYGARQAAGVVLRTACANVVNFCATVSALATFAAARLRWREVSWAKTEHAYPDRDELLSFKRLLGEFLLDQHVLSADELDGVLLLQSVQRDPLRIGDLVVRCALATEQQVVDALSRQHGVPLFEPHSLTLLDGPPISRSAAERHGAIPVAFRQDGGLLVATSELLPELTVRELQLVSGHRIQASLATPSDWELAFVRVYARLEAEVADALVEMGAVLRLQIVEARVAARRFRRPLPQVLYDRRWADAAALKRAFESTGHEFRRLAAADVTPETPPPIPPWLHRQLRAVPIERRQDAVVVAIAEALAAADQRRLEAAAGSPVKFVYTLLSDLLPLLPKAAERPQGWLQ